MDEQVNGGAILLARQIFESEIFIWKPAIWFKVWVYILGNVFWKDKGRLKRGQGYFTYKKIMDATGASRDQVKHCLEYLRLGEAPMCATRKAPHGLVLTVLNYDRYQSVDTYRSPMESPTKAPQKPHRSPTNKEVSKEREERKKEISNDISISAEIDIRLVQLLVDLMAKNNPKSHILKNLTKKKQEAWLSACRLMREKDERTPKEIEAIIKFSQSDEFWKSNILSMPKLREKFDQLWLKAQKSNYSGIASWYFKQEKKYGKSEGF